MIISNLYMKKLRPRLVSLETEGDGARIWAQDLNHYIASLTGLLNCEWWFCLY